MYNLSISWRELVLLTGDLIISKVTASSTLSGYTAYSLVTQCYRTFESTCLTWDRRCAVTDEKKQW